MGIFFDEKSRSFKLDTKKSSYVISVVDDEGFIGHAYYGDRISDTDVRYLLRTDENPFVPSKNNRDRGSFLMLFRRSIREIMWEITGRVPYRCVVRTTAVR